MAGPKRKVRHLTAMEEKQEIDNLKKWIASRKPMNPGSNPVHYQNENEKMNNGELLFSELPTISQYTKDGLRDCNYVEMTYIQRASLPYTLCGRDFFAASKTGTGKTLAFIIPILEKLYRDKWNPEDGVRCIIISPTKELASQNFDLLNRVGRYHCFSAGLLIEDHNGADTKDVYVNDLNILVCTPESLLQHMTKALYFNCTQLQILVLDEADSSLDESFWKDVEAIVSQLPKDRQTLLFSATQSKEVKDLARLSLENPECLVVHENDPKATALDVQVKQNTFVEKDNDDKMEDSQLEGTVEDEVDMSSLVQFIEHYCSHPGFIGDVCIKCGEIVYDKHGTLPFDFLVNCLRLDRDEITRLCDVDLEVMMCQKKLHLVLDLDHTLLHSINLRSITPEEKYLTQKDMWKPMDDPSKGSLYLAETKNLHRMVKLRPYIWTFLEEASKLFCMSISTFARRDYALAMAKILDPSGTYFGSRVVSRDDCYKKKRKRLNAVLGHERLVLVLDDIESFWEAHKKNLILMQPYRYFYNHRCGRNKSLSQRKSDEDETEGALANALRILTQVHSMFFDPKREDDSHGRDVRKELEKFRNAVLKDCIIVIPKGWTQTIDMAKKLGATICEACKCDPSATHVISSYEYVATEVSSWAISQGKFLVRSEWVLACYHACKRLPEENYHLSPRYAIRSLGVKHRNRWAKLCRIKMSHTIRIFMWRAISDDILPTNHLLLKRCKLGDGLCSICGLKNETALHLFFYCKSARMEWIHKWNIEPDKYKFSSIRHWFDAVISPCERNWCRKQKEEDFAIFAFTLAYNIWGARNILKQQGIILPDPSNSSFSIRF